MSVRALGWAFNQTIGDPTAKLVLIALCDFCNEDGTCWPSRKKIAAYADCSVDTVDRKLRELCAKGLLKIEPRKAAAGDQTSNLYRLTPPQSGSRNLRPPLPQDAATQPQLCGHHVEPSVNQSEKFIIPESLRALNGFEAEWKGFLEVRTTKKVKNTARACQLILNLLAERPHCAVQALQTAIRRNWTGIEWSWIDKDKPSSIPNNVVQIGSIRSAAEAYGNGA